LTDIEDGKRLIGLIMINFDRKILSGIHLCSLCSIKIDRH
jgi:hypothetical protein